MTLPDSTIPQKLTSLRKSKFRSKFNLAQKDREYIAAKGLETIKEHAYQFINSRIAPDFPKNDGKQTPMKGHPVFMAQHATATCCRGCISKWHDIEKGRAFNDAEVDYVVALIMGWIEWQIDKNRFELCENLCEKNFPKSAKIGKSLENHTKQFQLLIII